MYIHIYIYIHTYIYIYIYIYVYDIISGGRGAPAARADGDAAKLTI